MILMEFFVGTNGTISAEAEEHGLDNIVTENFEGGVPFDAGVAYIVMDTNGEVGLGVSLAHFIVNTLDHCGGEIPWRKDHSGRR